MEITLLRLKLFSLFRLEILFAFQPPKNGDAKMSRFESVREFLLRFFVCIANAVAAEMATAAAVVTVATVHQQ